MSKCAYAWVLGTIIFGFWFHSHEENQRRQEIREATSKALYLGVDAGCVRDNLPATYCDRQAKKLVDQFLRNSR